MYCSYYHLYLMGILLPMCYAVYSISPNLRILSNGPMKIMHNNPNEKFSTLEGADMVIRENQRHSTNPGDNDNMKWYPHSKQKSDSRVSAPRSTHKRAFRTG